MSTTGRAVSKHTPRYHYALLLVETTTGLAIDRPSLLQLLQKELAEWFGTAGGVNSNEVEVVSVQPMTRQSVDGKGISTDRRVVLRFPRSITPQLLTALPLMTSSSHRIQLLNDSSDLSRLNGSAGQGRSGYEEWRQGILAV
ncbi:uncharacterized protein JCM6883_000733 [Sporobolomyces salmoneus]|uniref:uncharacterized protein n=1 Tax=Sporobolomyces salmoneus TaxID=183962 RepID=UPI00317400AA